MLNIGSEKLPLCSGPTRRSFLTAGMAGAAALALPTLERLKAAGAVDDSKAKIRNCIVIFLVGSPGQLDTWDMKPDAPENVRGKFKPIKSNVAGIQICEHFPLMSKMMDKVALIRSLSYNTGASHENGQRWMMTGHDFNADNMKPHMGSVIARVFGSRGDLPANVILPGPIGNTGAGPLHVQTAAYLGSAHAPFFLNADPARSDFKVTDLEATAMVGLRLVSAQIRMDSHRLSTDSLRFSKNSHRLRGFERSEPRFPMRNRTFDPPPPTPPFGRNAKTSGNPVVFAHAPEAGWP